MVQNIFETVYFCTFISYRPKVQYLNHMVFVDKHPVISTQILVIILCVQITQTMGSVMYVCPIKAVPSRKRW